MNRTWAKREKQIETTFPTAFASVCAARGMNLDSPS